VEFYQTSVACELAAIMVPLHLRLWRYIQYMYL